MKKVILAVIFCLICFASVLHADVLTDYLSKPEPAFGFKELSSEETSNTKNYELSMTSLTYKNTDWQHHISVVIPKVITAPDTAVLAAVMGNDVAMLNKISGLAASMLGCPIVVVWNVPNATPGMSDDAAIAKTLADAVSTGNQEDILLLPMTKSVIKAMDVCDSFLKSKGTNISKYVIGGPSKDGWITWLTAASQDKRVAGIIPVIFDFLDMEKQLELQKNSYGKYSDMINIYTSFETLLASDNGKKVLKTVDPINYVSKINVPKLIINATNDSYWNIDSANIYWKKLTQPKYLLYAVNLDHGKSADGSDIDPLSFLPLLNTVTMFIEKCAGVSDMPSPIWNWSNKNGIARCTVKAPEGAELSNGTAYICSGPTKDLRKAQYKPVPMTKIKNQASIMIKADENYKAAVCQITLTYNNKPYVLFTAPQVIDAKK